MVLNETDNLRRQQAHYDTVYRADPKWVVEVTSPDRFEAMFRQFRRWNTLSYGSFYFGDLQHRLNGKRVLEFGFGDGDHSLFMARFGATVLGVEVSDQAVSRLNSMAARVDLADRVSAISVADLWAREAEFGNFDFVFGKAFLHHLTHHEEERYVAFAARVLNSTGEARFFEPAHNSSVLERLRWSVPTKGRPSILSRRKFAAWKARDPHPERDNSSRHYRDVIGQYFGDMSIVPMEALQRLSRFFDYHTRAYHRAKRTAQAAEAYIPRVLHAKIARAQTIICKLPRKSVSETGRS